MSGEEVLAQRLVDFILTCGATEHPILALKRRLHGLCGHSRFKQRLMLEDGTTLLDSMLLKRAGDLQLILLPFVEPSPRQVLDLMVSSRDNNIAKVEEILQVPLDPDITVGGQSPLFIASTKGNLEIVHLLLEAGAEKDEVSDSGASPLFMACKNNHLKVVQLLLKVKADTNKARRDGATPLATRAVLNK